MREYDDYDYYPSEEEELEDSSETPEEDANGYSEELPPPESYEPEYNPEDDWEDETPEERANREAHEDAYDYVQDDFNYDSARERKF